MRDEQLGITLERLLSVGDEATYRALWDRSEAGLFDRLRGLHLANRFTIRLWTRAPSDDWSVLCDQLDPEGTKVEAPLVDQLLERLIAGFPDTDEAIQAELPSMLRKAIEVRNASEEPPAADHPAIAELERQLEDPHEWVSQQASVDEEERLYRAADALRALGPDATGRVEKILVDNVVRGLQSMAVPPQGPDEAATALEGSLRLSAFLNLKSLPQVARAVPEFSPDDEENAVAAEVLARAGLAKLARSGGLEADESAFQVVRQKLTSIARGGSRLRHDAIGAWLGLAGSVDEVWAVLSPMRGTSSAIDAGLEAWADSVKITQRTALAKKLLNRPVFRADQLAAVAKVGVTEKALSEELKLALLRPTNDYGRRRLVQAGKAIGFSTQNSGQVISEAACRLLAKGRPRSDISVAVLLIEVAPNEHLKPQLIGTALKGACKRHSYQLTGKEVKIVTGARILVNEKMVKKSFRKKIPKIKNPFKRD